MIVPSMCIRFVWPLVFPCATAHTYCSQVRVLQFENFYIHVTQTLLDGYTVNYANVEKGAHRAVQLMELGFPLRLHVLFPPAWQLSTKFTRRFYLPQVQAASCCSLLQSTKLLL